MLRSRCQPRRTHRFCTERISSIPRLCNCKLALSFLLDGQSGTASLCYRLRLERRYWGIGACTQWLCCSLQGRPVPRSSCGLFRQSLRTVQAVWLLRWPSIDLRSCFLAPRERFSSKKWRQPGWSQQGSFSQQKSARRPHVIRGLFVPNTTESGCVLRRPEVQMSKVDLLLFSWRFQRPKQPPAPYQPPRSTLSVHFPKLFTYRFRLSKVKRPRQACKAPSPGGKRLGTHFCHSNLGTS